MVFLVATGAEVTGPLTDYAGIGESNTADGGAIWAIGDNDQTTLTNPSDDAQLNVLDVAADRIVYGGSTAEVEALAGALLRAYYSAATDFSNLITP